MYKSTTSLAIVLGLLSSLFFYPAQSNQVNIISAEFHNNKATSWSVSVTLKHDDKGWDHYADSWRIVTDKGQQLGKRVLYHPHVTEQPFTRSLGGVVIPEGVTTVFIEAHDKIHGWSDMRLKVDLSKAENGRLKVPAK